MLKKLFAVILFAAFASNVAYANLSISKNALKINKSSTSETLSTEIIVKFNPQKINLKNLRGKVQKNNFSLQNNLKTKKDLNNLNISVFQSTTKTSVSSIIKNIKKNPNVLYAEPNYKRDLFTINTNDEFKDQLWALDNVGQLINDTYTGTTDSDIDAPEAFNLYDSSQSPITVAVIDSGVYYSHADLAANMWDGTNCKNSQGEIIGGCLHGYDFENNDSSPADDTADSSRGHGTIVAGIIGAVGNNGIGILGANPYSKIMAIKFGLDVASEIESINFAIQNGAKIINASYGGYNFSQAEYDAIKTFKDNGGLFVTAAGNQSANVDTSPIYPCAHDLDNIICVAASDMNDNFAADFSNYGNNNVDISAPGVEILSTYYYPEFADNIYAFASGTSMAAPEVSGVASLIWAIDPTFTYSQVKNILINSGDSIASMVGKTASGKRLNALKPVYEVLKQQNNNASISGNIKYYDGVQNVPNANINLEDSNNNVLSSVVSNAEGNFEFSDAVKGQDYKICASKNDQDSSNGISSSDLIKIRRHIVGLEIFDPIYKMIAADINLSLSVSASDLIKIRRYIVGLEYPVNDWTFYPTDASINEQNYLQIDKCVIISNLDENLTNQNFIGIKYGDVNNSWVNQVGEAGGNVSN
ncbi:MAG: S8 family serine peptidase [Candidatus Gracilibacteria bacterium]|jgi:subtilisin family serine protease